MSEELWNKRVRNWAGFLGGVLPWLALFSAWLYGKLTGGLSAGFWDNLSISATYYCSPALPAILTAASIVLMCYDGYELIDNIVTTISGLFGLLIVLFPCKCKLSTDFVGFFQVPEDVSQTVHCVSAAVFFCLLAFNALFLFTKHDGEMTEKKKVRNILYRICGIGMTISIILLVVPFSFPAKVWWLEMSALTFFSMSWLIKSGAFPFLNDKE